MRVKENPLSQVPWETKPRSTFAWYLGVSAGASTLNSLWLGLLGLFGWLALADRFLGLGWLLSGVVDSAILLVNWTIAVSPTGLNRTPRISLKPWNYLSCSEVNGWGNADLTCWAWWHSARHKKSCVTPVCYAAGSIRRDTDGCLSGYLFFQLTGHFGSLNQKPLPEWSCRALPVGRKDGLAFVFSNFLRFS